MSRESGQHPSSYQISTTTTESAPTEGLSSPISPTTPYTDGRPVEMAALPHPPHIQQQDPYRSHPGYNMYSPHNQSFPPTHQTASNSSQPPPSFPAQPAPRQRTAIACRYCRRRKIRCHGFDSSPDGRCTNCMRFHQECIFTPVSSQAHAFVPAHTAYPHLRNLRNAQTDGRPLPYAPATGQPGPPLYGAHGQPLGPVGHEPGYGAPPPQPGYTPGPYSVQPPPQVPPPSMHYDERGPAQDNRTTPIRRPSSDYKYPDPTSPGSSTGPYQTTPYTSSGAQSYYQSTSGAQRTSPTSAYFAPRPAESPRGTNGTPVLPPLPPGLHPPQSLPPGFEPGRNHSPSTAPTSGTRSSTDSEMLNALNRTRR